MMRISEGLERTGLYNLCFFVATACNGLFQKSKENVNKFHQKKKVENLKN